MIFDGPLIRSKWPIVCKWRPYITQQQTFGLLNPWMRAPFSVKTVLHNVPFQFRLQNLACYHLRNKYSVLQKMSEMWCCKYLMSWCKRTIMLPNNFNFWLGDCRVMAIWWHHLSGFWYIIICVQTASGPFDFCWGHPYHYFAKQWPDFQRVKKMLLELHWCLMWLVWVTNAIGIVLVSFKNSWVFKKFRVLGQIND